MRVLGLIIRSDMKWSSNTENMVSKANKKLWILRRPVNSGARTEDLLDVYCKQVRSLLELDVPAWQSGIKLEEKSDIERIQKSACHIIMGENYNSYKNALRTLGMVSLEERREMLSLNFAKKAEKNENF